MFIHCRASRFILVLVVAAGAPRASWGQSTEQAFSLSRFEPAERGSSWFFGDSLDLRGTFAWSAGAVGDYAYKPLVITNDVGTERAVVVRHFLQVHVGGSVTLLDRVRIGVSLPVIGWAEGSAGQLGGMALGAPRGPALGDLRVSADVRVVGVEGDPFTLVAGARVWFPTAGAMSYGGDGRWRVSPQLLAAGTYQRLRWSARVGYVWRERSLAFPDSSVGSEVTFGASAGVTFFDGKLLVGPEAFATTRASTDESFAELSTPVEVMLGAHYRGTSWVGGLGVAKGLVRGVGEPLFRVVASFEGAPSRERPRDTDGDGVPDTEDACQSVAGVRSAEPMALGCPDRDADGVTDERDACVALPGVKSDDSVKHGCPLDTDGDGFADADDPCPAVAGAQRGCPPDRDGDGVANASDACPTTPGATSADPAKHGCAPDSDGDGIFDADDACAAEAGAASPKPAFNGCPLTRDQDADAVFDRADACPTEAGRPHADPGLNGCPVGAVVGGQLVLEQVRFKTGSAVVLPQSDATLAGVLETLKRLPDTNRYRVEGHTDDQGSAASNRALSQRRAQAVVSWFVKHGLSPRRFDANGFGPDRPLAPNDTDEHRQGNRRVEIHIVEGTNELPAGR